MNDNFNVGCYYFQFHNIHRYIMKLSISLETTNIEALQRSEWLILMFTIESALCRFNDGELNG